ncbi:ras guanine nucleotide exchange factor domain-containing protein [Chlamydoabsidia padenii]|nr:ras guanine nucleotide exchange factor domain-containing protein [Chlamydoabsidia padenii]
MFLEIDHDPKENGLTTTLADAALICYDVTQLQSMIGVSDLIDLYHSHHQLPVLLLGLKSDLVSSRQVDFTLGKELAQQHSVPFYEMKTASTLDVQHILMKLIRQCIKSTTDTIRKKDIRQKDHQYFPIKPSGTTGFVYAPTTTQSTAQQSNPLHEISPSRKCPTDNFINYRRGSKDSCDSFGTGLTVDDIIDRLVSPEMNHGDDQMLPIFVIFFRKFMTPTELIQALVKRVKNDLCVSEQSILLQKRIILLLTTWITNYWSDFYHQHTRDQLNLLIEHLSTTTTGSSLKHTIDTLFTLSQQPSPDYDIDDCWGKKDSDTTRINHDKKKDSGFISSYYGTSTHTFCSLDPAANDSNTMSRGHNTEGGTTPSLTTTSSSPSQRSSIIPASNSINHGIHTFSSKSHATTLPVNPITLYRSASMTSPSYIYTKSAKPIFINQRSNSIRQPSLIPTYSTNSNTRSVINPAAKTSSLLTPTVTMNRPEFAGGTMLIDLWKSPQPNKPSYTNHAKHHHGSINNLCTKPNRRCFRYMDSTTNIFSTFLKPVSPDKWTTKTNMYFTSRDSTFINFNTNMLLSTSDQEMAEQLTWIEAELFGNIESREFVRMIWANTKQQRTRHNSMTSSSPGEQDDDQSIYHDTSRYMKKSGLLASISHFNFISAWVISMVVMQPKLGKRVALLEKWMTIAVALRDLNNYNTLMAILAGINNAALIRLKQTQERIKKKNIYKRFRSLEKLMSSDRSYTSYRTALKAPTTEPSLPYLGIHSQDLIALAEANKDIKKDGTIHWEKFRLMGECITSIIQFQQTKHQLAPNPMILSWIANYHILTEDEQYQQSTRAEPRLKTTYKNSLRGLWLRT